MVLKNFLKNTALLSVVFFFFGCRGENTRNPYEKDQQRNNIESVEREDLPTHGNPTYTNTPDLGGNPDTAQAQRKIESQSGQ